MQLQTSFIKYCFPHLQHFQIKMAKPNPIRVVEQVPDANLLDDDDDEPTLDLHVAYDHTFDTNTTPRSSGKDIRIDSPHPADMPKTPPATPPRQGTSSHTPPANPESSKIHITTGKHYTKLGIYLHTERRPSLTKMIITQHPCSPKFYTNANDLNRIIEKAKFLLMNHEPYFTLLQEGYNFNLVKPQLSYKVMTLDEKELIDFVANLNHGAPSSTDSNPIPFYEYSEGSNYTQTDVSFLFKIQPKPEPKRPKMVDQSNATCGINTLSPIIDSIFNAAPLLQAAQQANISQETPPAARPALSLANTAPPRHIIEPSPPSSQRIPRPRTHDRLGPPVSHDFRDRSRSHDDRHRRGREYRRRI